MNFTGNYTQHDVRISVPTSSGDHISDKNTAKMLEALETKSFFDTSSVLGLFLIEMLSPLLVGIRILNDLKQFLPNLEPSLPNLPEPKPQSGGARLRAPSFSALPCMYWIDDLHTCLQSF